MLDLLALVVELEHALGDCTGSYFVLDTQLHVRQI
jgi:hypothetical protein